MPNVVVIGGGIGGLSVAIALRKRGFEAEIYEATDAHRSVGSGLGLAANAMQVLERLDIADDVTSRGTSLERVRFQDASGTVLGEYSLQRMDKRFGHTTTVLRWAELQQALVDHVRPDSLYLNSECSTVIGHDDHVKARFTDGTEIEADLLIGADGIRSVVREQIFSDAKLRYAGQISYRGIAAMEPPRSLQGTGVETWGRGIRFGVSPLDADHLYWFAVITAPPGDYCDVDERRKTLVELYRDFPDPIPRIIAHTDEENIIHTDQYDLSPLDRWSAGRVVLLGDAAHAATPDLGQGAAQALEDGCVLADRLATHPDYPDAFRSYERIRKPKARLIAKRSRQWARLTQVENEVLITIRNGVFRLLPASIAQRRWERICELDF